MYTSFARIVAAASGLDAERYRVHAWFLGAEWPSGVFVLKLNQFFPNLTRTMSPSFTMPTPGAYHLWSDMPFSMALVSRT